MFAFQASLIVISPKFDHICEIRKTRGDDECKGDDANMMVNYEASNYLP